MILLDTNVLSELMKREADVRVITWLDKWPLQHVFISVISKAEIEYGVLILPAGKRKKQIADAAEKVFMLFDNRILPFNSKTTSYFADIKSKRKSIGRPISYADAQIAAIALQHRLRFATRNTTDFEAIHGLEVINPWDG